MFKKIFSPATFDPTLAPIEALIVVVPFVILAFAVLELLRRRRLH